MLPALATDLTRRRRARQLVRRLQPAADAVGGFASAELRLPGGATPLVAVVVGDPPADGVLAGPPLLVLTDADDAPEWLAGGVAVVWHLTADDVVVHTAGAPPEPADPATVPGMPALTVPAAHLLR